MRFSLLSILTVLVANILFQNAEAKNFYRAKMRLKLTYSTAFERTKTLERESAQVVFSDDSSFCLLKIDNNTYNCDASLINPRNYSVTIESKTLKEILVANFGMTPARAESLKLSSYPRIKYYGTDRTSKFQFHTDKNEESFHLIVVARKARKQ